MNIPRDRNMCQFIFRAIYYRIALRRFARSSARARSTGSRFNGKPEISILHTYTIIKIQFEKVYTSISRVHSIKNRHEVEQKTSIFNPRIKLSLGYLKRMETDRPADQQTRDITSKTCLKRTCSKADTRL